jgi:hypothetical protein
VDESSKSEISQLLAVAHWIYFIFLLFHLCPCDGHISGRA